MNEEHKPYNIEYTFHVQSAEDFYAQLYKWTDEHYKETDITDTALAKQMLEHIGISVK